MANKCVAGSPEFCVNCGMPPLKEEDTIPITLLFSRASRQVLCAEVGKDFVDMLMGFLTLPASCIVKVLADATLIHKPEENLEPLPVTPPSIPPNVPYTPRPKKDTSKYNEHFALTSIFNIFDSVLRFEDESMAIDKRTLLDARPTNPFGAGRLLNTRGTPKAGEEAAPPLCGYYSCGAPCTFATAVAATKCPKHKNKMITPLKFVEDMPPDPIDKTAGQKPGGYVKPGSEFMVTNSLEIFASSAFRAVISLNVIRSERVGDLDTMEVYVVAQEVLQLLKASFTSTDVLNEVFGKYCADAKASLIAGKGKSFFPQCQESPCCQSSRMRVPLNPSVHQTAPRKSSQSSTRPGSDQKLNASFLEEAYQHKAA